MMSANPSSVSAIRKIVCEEKSPFSSPLEHFDHKKLCKGSHQNRSSTFRLAQQFALIDNSVSTIIRPSLLDRCFGLFLKQNLSYIPDLSAEAR